MKLFLIKLVFCYKLPLVLINSLHVCLILMTAEATFYFVKLNVLVVSTLRLCLLYVCCVCHQTIS